MPSGCHGVHAEPIEIGGKTYYVRREFDLARRIEERAGPIRDIIRDIVDGERTMGRLPVAKIAAVLEECLRGQLTRGQIEEHIMQVGLMRAMLPVAVLANNFFIGDERLQAIIDAQRGGGGQQADPQKAASSPGQALLERPPS